MSTSITIPDSAYIRSHLKQSRNVLLVRVHVEVLHDENELLRRDRAAVVRVEQFERLSKLLNLLDRELVLLLLTAVVRVAWVAVHD